MPLSKDINLLAGKEEGSAQKERKIRLVRAVSLALLAVYSLILIITFSFWFYTNRKSQQVEQQINLKKRQIKDLEKIESLQLTLKGRLTVIRQILAQGEPDYSLFLNYFNQFSSEGIDLSSFAFASDGQLVLSGSAENAPGLSSFLEEIISQEALFSRVNLTTIVRTEEGGYNFDLELEVNG
jgi:Tfp pilus assembly protein PilN